MANSGDNKNEGSKIISKMILQEKESQIGNRE